MENCSLDFEYFWGCILENLYLDLKYLKLHCGKFLDLKFLELASNRF
jgi:hypothetical protein